MTVSKILTVLFKNIFTGMTIYGVSVAMAHGAFMDRSTFFDISHENTNESE